MCNPAAESAASSNRPVAHAHTNWSRIKTMDELPLNALRAFAQTCTHGGVRAAARALQVSHSSVSRHLAELEAWLGVPLFEQEGGRRRWQPTAEAERLGRALGAAFADIASATAAMREQRSPFSVTLATTPSLAARWLLPRLPALERAHPRIELSVLVNQRFDDLAAAGIDLAIRMGAGPWPGLRGEVLMDDRLYPVMGPALWEAAGRPHDVDALADMRLLHDRDPQAGWERWRATHGPAALALQRGPRYASSDLLLRAAMQGQGVALARDRLARDDVEAGLLLRPFGTLAVAVADAYWIVQPPRTPRAAVSTVVRWLREQALA